MIMPNCESTKLWTTKTNKFKIQNVKIRLLNNKIVKIPKNHIVILSTDEKTKLFQILRLPESYVIQLWIM